MRLWVRQSACSSRAHSRPRYFWGYLALTVWMVILAMLEGCASPTPSPTVSPLRLPTRAPRTPTPIPALAPVTAQAYYEEGLARQEAGDVEGALQSFNWAIELAPDFALAYLARAGLYLARGSLDWALADADAALKVDPANAAAYALRGEAFRLQRRSIAALEAFDRAIDLDPALRAETFRSRWLAARATYGASRLLPLSGEYATAHPDDPLRHYYHAWALLQSGQPRAAISALAEEIEATPHPPALLWFTLGQAYMADRSWREAVASLEVTRELVQVGDTSLAAHSDRPIADLFGALGLAYLRAGRCLDAERTLQYAVNVGAPEADYTGALDEARLCQTPTPTTTPYPTTTPSWP